MGAPIRKSSIKVLSKMETEESRFNKRALVGSVIIHLFFLLLKLPKLEMEHKLKEDPKLIPIKLTEVKFLNKTNLTRKNEITQKLNTTETQVTKEVVKTKNGSDRVVEKTTALGNPLKDKVQVVQKGDPRSKLKEEFKKGTDLRKLPKNDVGTGAARSKVMGDGVNTGGQGDTYKGVDMTNVTDSLFKKGNGLKRTKVGSARDDGGAGGGTGGGLGTGVGGGSGDGRFTGTTTGTVNPAKIAKNVGSLTGAAKGSIDSSKGFDGLATKGSIMVSGVPVEKVAVSVINPDEIKRLLREHIPQFRYCYQTELDKSKNPVGLQGRIQFNFFIAQNGKAQNAAITSEEISSDDVRSCIKNVLLGIQFPKPLGGKSVQVNQPMNLYPRT